LSTGIQNLQIQKGGFGVHNKGADQGIKAGQQSGGFIGWQSAGTKPEMQARTITDFQVEWVQGAD
jgi:hypothetical protein